MIGEEYGWRGRIRPNQKFKWQSKELFVGIKKNAIFNINDLPLTFTK